MNWVSLPKAIRHEEEGVTSFGDMVVYGSGVALIVYALAMTVPAAVANMVLSVYRAYRRVVEGLKQIRTVEEALARKAMQVEVSSEPASASDSAPVQPELCGN